MVGRTDHIIFLNLHFGFLIFLHHKLNFSILKWFIGNKRTRLGIKKLEGMAKIRTYFMTNIRNALTHYGKELMDSE